MADSDFFLDFSICKSTGKNETDKNGNYIFEVEASNENIDLQNQIVLQDALMKSKENFITKGVISFDHLHKQRDENGNVISHPEMIIGEPIDVWTVGKSTFVKGILYKSNEIAQDLIQKLKDGSTRIRASVGGIFPKIKKAANGVEQITSVLWNDLALTTSPVNNSVGNATFAKSMNAAEFAEMYKSLSAGYGTDSATMTDGRAMTKEDLEKKTVNVVPESNGVSLDDLEDDEKSEKERAKKSLCKEMEKGNIYDFDDSMNYLSDVFGLSVNKSLEIVNEILSGGNEMFKGKFQDTCSELLKSMKKSDENADDDTVDLDNDEGIEKSTDKSDEQDLFSNSDDDDSDDDEEEVEKSKKGCKKSTTTEGFDATELLKSLNENMTKIGNELSEMKKALAASEARNAELENMVKSMQDEPLPMQSVMSKSVNDQTTLTAPNGAKPTMEDFEEAKDILCKSVKEGRLELQKSIKYEHEIQLCMATGKAMSNECFSFISSEMKRG